MGWQVGTYSRLKRGAAFVADTALHVWTNITTIPQVTLQYMVHPAARQVGTSLLRILAEDILPYVMLNQGILTFQQYLDSLYDEDQDGLPTFYAIQAVNSILQASLYLYGLRNIQRRLARTTVLSLENNQALSEIRSREAFTVCRQERCSPVRFLHGDLRDLIIFNITEVSLFLLSLCRTEGLYLSIPFSIYHTGRYALSASTPEMCQRHRAVYLDEQKSLALSLGLTHQVIVYATSYAMNYGFRLPASAFAPLLQVPALIPTIAIASQLDLAKPKTECPIEILPDNRTTWKDPFALYESILGWGIDLVLAGLKKKGPQLLKDLNEMISWDYELVLLSELEAAQNNLKAKMIEMDIPQEIIEVILDNLVEPCKLYLSEGGEYVVRDLNGKVQQGQLDEGIDLSHLTKRLAEPGLKKAILAYTTDKGYTRDWEKIIARLGANKMVRLTKLVFIADCFQDTARIKQDPVIKVFWSKLCLGVADIAETTLSWVNSTAVRLLTYHELITQFALHLIHLYRKCPKNLINILVSALTNEKVKQKVSDMAEYLKKESKIPEEPQDSYIVSKTKQFGKMIESILQINAQDAIQVVSLIVRGIAELRKPRLSQHDHVSIEEDDFPKTTPGKTNVHIPIEGSSGSSRKPRHNVTLIQDDSTHKKNVCLLPETSTSSPGNLTRRHRFFTQKSEETKSSANRLKNQGNTVLI